MRSRAQRARRYAPIEEARALVAGDNPGAEASIRFDELMAEADELEKTIERLDRVQAADDECSEAWRNDLMQRGQLD